MRTRKILLIENARANGVSFATALKRKYQVHIAHSGKQGLMVAQVTRPDVIVVDAASLRTSGNRICAQLRTKLGALPIIHVRAAESKKEKSGGKKEKPRKHTPKSAADVVLTMPFTARKLINRIERFVVQPGGELLVAGPFTLNLEKQTLTAPWAEKKLTPKLVMLMEQFMRNPNQTLERRELMQKVWNTDYMGDTRTLDVHIRWIRDVVEPESGKKTYLKTVRGVGYRLDLPEDSTKPEPSKPATSKRKKQATPT
ncbi:response regulator transcription factor [Aggregatilinea lenta]|uniref:response regulator transcription factor n=1 Tax=Aggregatilinea lenta TaxID=913108 RepID=UPI000E5BB99A|nr:response regulator transcription factor [Aggregatilinea lenta]